MPLLYKEYPLLENVRIVIRKKKYPQGKYDRRKQPEKDGRGRGRGGTTQAGQSRGSPDPACWDVVGVACISCYLHWEMEVWHVDHKANRKTENAHLVTTGVSLRDSSVSCFPSFPFFFFFFYGNTFLKM